MIAFIVKFHKSYICSITFNVDIHLSKSNIKKTNQQNGVLKRLWSRLPVLVRAILLGSLISIFGIFIWTLMASFIPMPWAFVFMAGALILYIKYFSGSWKPLNTQAFRKLHFRRTHLSLKSWPLAIIGIILIVLIEQSSLVITFRLMEFPAEMFIQEYSFLQTSPTWIAWLVIIMISAVAAICEEIGFRGYMQLPLENKYGPITAISIVSVIFVLVHLHQAWSGPIIIQLFLISVLFGTMAYVTKSLIPGIIAHFIMDVCNFSFWWSDLGYQFNKSTIMETGIDTHFIGWIVAFIVAIISFIFVSKKLYRKNKTA